MTTIGVSAPHGGLPSGGLPRSGGISDRTLFALAALNFFSPMPVTASGRFWMHFWRHRAGLRSRWA